MVVAFYFRLHLAYFPRPVVAIFARPEQCVRFLKELPEHKIICVEFNGGTSPFFHKIALHNAPSHTDRQQFTS